MNLPIVLCFSFFGFALARPGEKFLSDDFIQEINRAQNSWIAGKNYINRPLPRGVKIISIEQSEYPLPLPLKYIDIVDNLPKNFDVREQWPECKSIKEIRDQSTCLGCWAFSATEAMSDRICIHSNATIQVTISAKNVISCCSYCGLGCHGGSLGMEWKYWVESGIVTGGGYGSNVGCQTYMYPSCEFDGTKGSRPPCKSMDGDTPPCVRQCDNSSGLNYQDELYYGKEVYMVHNTELEIMSEIYTNGPVQTYMDVYEDWITYKSGVYRHVTGDDVMNHMVKIIGWGVEDNMPYWLIANSFNEDWGDKGFFKILRGSNECNIERFILTGIPKL